MPHVLAQDLRNAVLQAAFEGKLTDTLSNDSQVTISSSFIGEEPYDLPDSWRWCCLRDVVWNRKQKKPDKPFSYIDIGSIDNEHQKLNDKETIIEPEKAPSRARKTVEIGDIVYSTVRPYLHNMAIIDRTFSHEPIASTGFAAMVCNKTIINRYLFNYLKSPFFDKYANDTDNSKGVAYPAINDKKLYAAPIPVCSLEEQARIVARVDELMAKIDEYEKIEKELVELQKRFPGEMKDAILQAAISGKLTQQYDDEKCSVLCKLITDKKKYVIKENDEYEIPDNWNCVQIGDVLDIVNGFTPLRSNGEFWDSNDIPWFTVDDIREQGRVIYKTRQHISNKALSQKTKRLLPVNTVLLCCTASVGEYAITKIKLTTNQQFNGLVIKEQYRNDIDPMYLLCFVQTLKNKLIDKAGKTTFNFLSTKKLSQFLFPLPPIEEQARIVEKLDQLLPLCEQLERVIS